MVGEEEEREARLKRDAKAGAGFLHREGGADRDGAVIKRDIGAVALGDERDDEAAHRFAFEEHAVGWAELFLDVVAERVEIGDGVGDDGAVASVAGLGDDPAFVEEGAISEMLREEVGDERAVGVAQAVGEEEDAGVPVSGAREGELGAIDFTGFERDGRDGGKGRVDG